MAADAQGSARGSSFRDSKMKEEGRPRGNSGKFPDVKVPFQLPKIKIGSPLKKIRRKPDSELALPGNPSPKVAAPFFSAESMMGKGGFENSP